mgnify:CR=1 FL=1
MKAIYDPKTKSVIRVEGLILVDIPEDANSTETLTDLAVQGDSLDSILNGCGHGDLHYGNCIAFSPSAVRDEIDVMLNNDYWADAETRNMVAQFTDEDIEWIGSYCTNSDYIWQVFGTELREAIIEHIYQKLKTKRLAENGGKRSRKK